MQSLLDAISLYESSKNPYIEKLNEVKQEIQNTEELLKLLFQNFKKK